MDDCPYLADALALVLKWWGYRAAVAYAGRSALALASADPRAAVLLDIGLPGLDGYEVARRLRAEPSGAELLLVAVSGYGQAQDRARSKEAGIDHHLTKPADFAVLRRILNGFPAAGARESMAETNGRAEHVPEIVK